MLDMRYVDALSHYQQARALDPQDVGLLYSLARAHQLLGDFPEALALLEEFERVAPAESKVRVGHLEQLLVDLRSRVATLVLRCDQAGARVLLRDRVVGTTPMRAFRVGSGVATLQVELDGFFPVQRQVVLPAGGSLEVEVELPARSTSSLLRIGTRPSGAVVFVDGKPIGTSTPRVELVVPAGAHQIEARREGYDDARVPVVLRAGTTRDVTVSLEKEVPITSRWWFWAGASVVAAGGVALGYALLTERPADSGTLSPGQVSAPLRLAF
jgi:PEGA domain/Tetratricopeptide repeat